MFLMTQCDKQSFCEQKIPQKDSRFVIPDFIDDEKTAPDIRLIHHIVMDQCGRMKQLNHRGSDIASMIYFFKHSCSHKDKGRSIFLAFLAKQVMDEQDYQTAIAGMIFL